MKTLDKKHQNKTDKKCIDTETEQLKKISAEIDVSSKKSV